MNTEVSADFQNILKESKRRLEANKRKAELLHSLKQLTVFSTLCNCIKTSENEQTSLDLVLCPEVDISIEQLSATVSIKNVSKSLVFSDKFWEFSITVEPKNQVVSWKLHDSLGPEQKISIDYGFDNISCSGLQITVNCIFSFGNEFVKVLQLKHYVIDILYCITKRRQTNRRYCDCYPAERRPWKIPLTATKPLSSVIEFPPVTMFELNLEPSSRVHFLTKILFPDVPGDLGEVDWRDWLSNSPVSPLLFYFGEEEIRIEMRRNDRFAFRCENSCVLFALKKAILRRLMVEKENLRVVDSSNSEDLEKLHELKLVLDEIDRGDKEKIVPDRNYDSPSKIVPFEENFNRESYGAALLKCYLQLRDLTESISLGFIAEVS